MERLRQADDTYDPVIALVLRNNCSRALAFDSRVRVVCGTETAATKNVMGVLADLKFHFVRSTGQKMERYDLPGQD